MEPTSETADTTLPYLDYIANTTNTTNISASLDIHQLVLDSLWVPLSLSLLLIICLGLLLNGVTLYMFYRNNRSPRRTSGSNQLVLNLTCCDLLVTCVAFPLLLKALVYERWPFGATGCKVYVFVFFFLGSVSNNSMAAIAVDRYYTVTQSQQAGEEAARRQIRHSLLAAWLTAVIATLPLLLGWSHIHLDTRHHNLCAPDWTTDDILDQSYPVFYAAVGLLAPFSVKAACYYQVYNKVHNVAKNVRKNHAHMSVFPLAVRGSRGSQSSISSKSVPCSASSVRRQSNVSTVSSTSAGSNMNPGNHKVHDSQDAQRKRQLARLLVVIVMSSLIAWAPYAVGLIALSFGAGVPPTAIVVTSLIAKSCVVYNPLAYVAFNKKFRKDFLKALKCQYFYSENDGTATGIPAIPGVVPRASSLPVLDAAVPANAGPNTRALHRYSTTSKRFSMPMLSTINEMESRYHNPTQASSPPESSSSNHTAPGELMAKSQARRPTAKCSLPESEIRKAQELMKGKNNRDVMQYLKKSRPQQSPPCQSRRSKRKVAPAPSSPDRDKMQQRPAGSRSGEMAGAQVVVRQQSLPAAARKASTARQIRPPREPLTRHSTVPMTRKTSAAVHHPPPCAPAAVRACRGRNIGGAVNQRGNPLTRRRSSMRANSLDSLNSMLSIISQNM